MGIEASPFNVTFSIDAPLLIVHALVVPHSLPPVVAWLFRFQNLQLSNDEKCKNINSEGVGSRLHLMA